MAPPKSVGFALCAERSSLSFPHEILPDRTVWLNERRFKREKQIESVPGMFFPQHRYRGGVEHSAAGDRGYSLQAVNILGWWCDLGIRLGSNLLGAGQASIIVRNGTTGIRRTKRGSQTQVEKLTSAENTRRLT